MARDMNPRGRKVSRQSISLAGALGKLNQVMDSPGPLSGTKLSGWLRSAGDLTAFSHFVVGMIEWKKSIGHPVAAPFANAFEIEAWRWEEVLEYTPRGVVFRKLKFPCAVTAWDAQHDAEYWRVNYIVNGVWGDLEHFVEVRLKSGVRWTPRSRFSLDSGVRTVQPGVTGFKRQGAIFLPRFEVVARPILILSP